MTAVDPAQAPERIAFFSGQRLLAADLQALDDFHRERREMHHRYLHQPGVGNGFEAVGSRGERSVRIGPGYALDALGHEIVLTATRSEQVPAVDVGSDGEAVAYDLTVSYPSAEDLEVRETRAGFCAERGAVRLREEPVFCWVRLQVSEGGLLRPEDARLEADIQNGLRLVLARVRVLHCQLDEDVSLSQRRDARPPTQPHIACGRVEEPLWILQSTGGGAGPGGGSIGFTILQPSLVFLIAQIDTTSAGFRSVPCYQARIEGPARLTGLVEEEAFFVQGFVSVEDPGVDGFRARVLLFSDLTGTGILQASLELAAEDPALLAQLFAPWSLVWMGVE